MFESSVSKDTKKNNNYKRRIPTYLLALCLILIYVKKLRISVEQGKMVTTLNIIKY